MYKVLLENIKTNDIENLYFNSEEKANEVCKVLEEKARDEWIVYRQEIVPQDDVATEEFAKLVL